MCENHLQFSWYEDGQISVANLNFKLQFPALTPSLAQEIGEVAMRFLSNILGKTAYAVNLALSYSLTLIGAVVLFMLFLVLQGNTYVVEV